MDQDRYDRGLAKRKVVLGAEYVEKNLAAASPFAKDFQELLTEYCWGAAWGDETLDMKTRSIINIHPLKRRASLFPQHPNTPHHQDDQRLMKLWLPGVHVATASTLQKIIPRSAPSQIVPVANVAAPTFPIGATAATHLNH